MENTRTESEKKCKKRKSKKGRLPCTDVLLLYGKKGYFVIKKVFNVSFLNCKGRTDWVNRPCTNGRVYTLPGQLVVWLLLSGSRINTCLSRTLRQLINKKEGKSVTVDNLMWTVRRFTHTPYDGSRSPLTFSSSLSCSTPFLSVCVKVKYQRRIYKQTVGDKDFLITHVNKVLSLRINTVLQGRDTFCVFRRSFCIFYTPPKICRRTSWHWPKEITWDKIIWDFLLKLGNNSHKTKPSHIG